ncbi:MAG: hypothetical protein COA41_14985 [Sphingopyxis sp.]|nr:MAG: hypothetical protein COA41_14985 [Sphingopyxis sp.]
MRVVSTGIAICVGIYLLLLLLVYVFQRQFLYFPDQSVTPQSDLDTMGIMTVEVRSGLDAVLQSLWIEPRVSDSPVLLFLHGNAGSHYDRIPIYQALAREGAAVLGVGYPGYGGNSGAPNETELYEAAQINYDWLIQKGINSQQIIIIGESLGSGVAAHLASQNEAAGLIMIAAHSGMDEMAQRQFPVFPARWLVKDRYPSLEHIDHIDMPLFWIHGTKDELIPFAVGQRLFDAAPEPKRTYPIKNGGHNDLWNRGIDGIIRDISVRLVSSASPADTAL